MSFCDKSPTSYISILKELMDKQQKIVEYQVTSQLRRTTENATIFEVSTFVNGKKYVGEGYSKQEAKSNAAKIALLDINRLSISMELGDHSNPGLGGNNIIANCTSNLIQFNAIGALQEYCVANSLGFPEYSAARSSGPSHAPTFTTVCKVGPKEVNVTSPTKKGGKHEAANKMFLLLKEKNDESSPSKNVNFNICKYYSDEEFMKKTEEAIINFEQVSISAKTKLVREQKRKTNLKHYLEETGVNLHHINLHKYYNGEQTLRKMEELLKKLKLRYDIEVQLINPYIVWVIFYGDKTHCCAGMGNSKEEAECALAEEVMLFFKLML